MKQAQRLIVFWLLFSLVLFANHVHWLGDYDKALHLSKKEHKSMLVLVVKKNDSFSHDIIKTQLMNQPYINDINQNMVSVIVTYEGRSNYPIEIYYTTVFPALFFVDTKTETFIREPLYAEQIEQKNLLLYFQPYLSKIEVPQH